MKVYVVVNNYMGNGVHSLESVFSTLQSAQKYIESRGKFGERYMDIVVKEILE